jgi:filamentous hemagglutinin
VDWTSVRDTLADGWDDFKYNVQCIWTCQWPGNGSLEANLAGLPIVPVIGIEGAGARLLSSVPGRVLSRINISNAGWAHVLERHFVGAGSRFSISQAQLRSLLGSKQVVGSPVVRTLESADGTRFVRQLDIGYTIGVDKFSGANTSILTVLSDKYGNLVTAFPGILQ